IHAGDIMGAAVLESMRPRSGVVIAVRGNNDLPVTWPESQSQVLEGIPEMAVVACQGGSIVVEHGHLLQGIEIDHFPLAYKYPDARMVVYGHTHLQRLDQDSLPWLVNPGASGMTRNNGGASCYQLQIRGQQWTMESYKFAPIRKAG
ncbi:MAG: metallophosphoesterase family protein, partial [bacterium]